MAGSEIKAYILSSYDYKNSGLIVKILTTEGLKTCFGNGFKNIKNGKNIYQNNYLNLMLSGEIDKEFIKIYNEKIISYNEQKVTDFKINNVLNIISELILKIDQLNYSYELFDFTIKMISKDNCKYFILMWLLHSYNLINKNISSNCCAECKSTIDISYFDPNQGGFMCSNCTSKTMDLQTLKALKKATEFEYESIFKLTNEDELIKIYTDYLVSSQGLYLKVLEKYVGNL